MKYNLETEQRIIETLWDPEIVNNPYEFVKYAYPWGKRGTPLEHYKGPRTWQRDELLEIAEHLKIQQGRMNLDETPKMFRKAMASGRGVGKSAVVSWLTNWMISTRPGSTVIIAANSEPQLRTKTFAEIGKWTTLLLNAHWFNNTTLSIVPTPWFEQCLKEQLKIDTQYYYAKGLMWSEENPDAFAGAHNPSGIMLVFDEASGIPISIFDVSEGFFTEPTLARFWTVYSNPRRNSGAFYDCFHDEKKKVRWRRRQLDATTVEGIDRALFEEIIEESGADSDKARIEVYGQFPKQGNRQFISNNLVRAAQVRVVESDIYAPLIMGVDVARYGDDLSVIRFRQGRDAKTIAPIKFKERDNMYVANEVARWIDKTNPDSVNIDAGNGTGVIDRLREMKYRVKEVWFGGKAESKEWANKRTEMYANMRDWLGGAVIDEDPALFRDLTAPEYDYFGKAQDSVMLESKESMKGRGLASPDDGDALALTFAGKVARRDLRASKASRSHVAQDVDYPFFS